jgi:hypothetical protein
LRSLAVYILPFKLNTTFHAHKEQLVKSLCVVLFTKALDGNLNRRRRAAQDCGASKEEEDEVVLFGILGSRQ